MKIKSDKVVIKKALTWVKNPMYVSGAYRLFTYVKWGSLPEEYKKFFPVAAADVWDKDLEQFKQKNIMLDLESEIKAVYRELIDKNLIHALGLIPIIIADAYMMDKPHVQFEAQLNKIINRYLEALQYDRDMAEVEAAYAAVDLLEQIVNKLKLNNRVLIEPLASYIDSAYSKLIASIDLRLSKEPKDITAQVSDDILKQADKALDEYLATGTSNSGKQNI